MRTPVTTPAAPAQADASAPAAAVARPDAAPLPTTPTQRVQVAFRSTPAGASVSVDGERLCNTPCEHEFERSERSVEVVFTRRGRRTMRTKIKLDANRELAMPLARRKPRPGGREGTGAPDAGKTGSGEDFIDP